MRKIISLVLLVNALKVFGQESPCENKYWPQTPVVATASKDESGIGGTGFVLPDDSALPHVQQGEEGIGGTGIIGVIAGFGSICVNGIEVHYNAMTPILEDGQVSSKQRLGLGQTVSILAVPNSHDYFAKEIRVLHEVQGKIDNINREENVFHILEQTVHLPESLLEKLSVGDTVAVSGNRLADGSIEALRVEQPLKMEKVNLIGELETDTKNHFYIGKQQLNIAENQARLHVGNEVSVQGVLQNGVLQVENLTQNPRWNFTEKVDQIFMQGYIRQSNAAEINIEGVHISPNDKIEKMPQIGDRTSAWVKISNEQPMLENLHPPPVLPEQMRDNPAIHELQDPNHRDIPRNNLDIERPRLEEHDLGIDKNMPLRPDIHVDEPTLLHLNVNKPETVKPEIVKPEMGRPELGKPEMPIAPPPEIMHIDTGKPTELRPEIHVHPIDLPNQK